MVWVADASRIPQLAGVWVAEQKGEVEIIGDTVGAQRRAPKLLGRTHFKLHIRSKILTLYFIYTILFNIVFYIYHNYIILYLCKWDPIHTIHNSVVLAHVFYLLNDLARWFLM